MKKQPNIVLIMADDMGFSDLGCYGSEISTPHLDRLAAGGMRFTQFYNTARCCPSRASLLTGLYAHQAGVGHMIRDLGAPAYQGYLNDRCVTIAEVLRENGYRTLMAGKWHVGEERPHWPIDRGFERHFGLISGGSSYFQVDKGRTMALDDKPFTPQGDFYMTDATTDYAVEFINDHRQEETPFFLYVAYTAPHWPLHARPQDIAKYRGKYMHGWDELRKNRHKKMMELGVADPKWTISPRDPRVPAWEAVDDKEAEDLKMAVYAAQIDRMDQGIGQIMEKIKESGAEENTLVLFLADNGGCDEKIDRGQPGVPPGSKESYLSYGVAWANASNTPLRLYKKWVHEGGISSPLIANWPARIAPGGVTQEVSHVIDLMATAVDAAGAQYPRNHHGRDITPLEGKSLIPILQGQGQSGHDAIYWEHQGNRAVRKGKWKLVAEDEGEWELYDLETDRTETNNLAAHNPQTVKELAALYEKWAARCGVVSRKDLMQKPKPLP